jgi:hypothetical protein
MKKILLFVGFSFLICSQSLFSQDVENKWVFGAGLGIAKFDTTGATVIEDQLIFQIPRFNVSRYMYKGITFDAALSFNLPGGIPFNNKITYFSFDGFARYDFGMSEESAVPYIVVGGSFIKKIIITPTLNVGLGNTLWFSQRYGLNVQALYKISPPEVDSLKSHFYFSVGLIYSLKLRTMVHRLWNGKKI